MKIIKSCLFAIIAILVPLASISPVQAASGISGVNPGNVSNATANVLTVTGTDFIAGDTVVVNGTNLATTLINATTLEATLPAGFPAGTYDVNVTGSMPTVTLPNALVVQAPTPTTPPTATNMPTDTPAPTNTPQPSAVRPIVVIETYKTNPATLTGGEDFNLKLTLENQGKSKATNLILVFSAPEVLPRQTGGVLSVGELDPGDSQSVTQPMTASNTISTTGLYTIDLTLNYSDGEGNPYSETFKISLNINRSPSSYGEYVPTATPTSQAIARPQLVITSYTANTPMLKPGGEFTLQMNVANVGSMEAQNVIMVAGGATVNPGSEENGNQGNVSAGSGEFTNFSPLGISNVQPLRDMGISSQMNAQQPLIVNVSTNPGAYPFKISFVYTDKDGRNWVDDQVITLLVYSPPVIDVSFYRDPGLMFTMQPNALPLQIVNLGKKSVVLGSMTVSASGAQVENSTMLIGALETGGYLTLDAILIPETPGPLTIDIVVDYTDDFNQNQQITKSLTVEVQEMVMQPAEDPAGMPPDAGGIPSQMQPETFWQKIGRFFKGLFGLDSSQPSEIIPQEQPLTEPQVQPAQPRGPKG